MLNTITIMGRLVRDPDLQRTSSGVAVVNFTVAVERDFPNKDTGEKETDFIDCIAWRQTGEFISKYFTKGQMIVVSGRLQVSTWTDKSGSNRKTAAVVANNAYFGDSKKDRESAPTNNMVAPGQNAYRTPYGYATPFNKNGVKPAVSDWDLLDDDDAQLPF